MILSLLMMGLLARSADASGCLGHYAKATGAQGSHFELLDLTGSGGEPSDAPTPEPSAPCAGVLCSGKTAPVPVPSLLLPASGGERGMLARLLPLETDPTPSPRSPAEPGAQPIDRSASIFHPPRASGVSVAA